MSMNWRYTPVVKTELDQPWTWLGALKLISYVGAALISGFIWYGLIVGGRAILQRFGVKF